MAYYKVMLSGTNIYIPPNKDTDKIIGFFTTRIVKANTLMEAEVKAKDMIIYEWSSSPYKDINEGSLPNLKIEIISKSGFLSSLLFKNKGYTFYSRDN